MSETISRREAATMLGAGFLTGTATRPPHRPSAQDRSQILNVRDFGARGDGSTDDTQAFRDAIAAAPQWGVVIVPPGFYILRDTVPCSKDRFTLMGYGSVDSGPEAAIIRYIGDGIALDAFNAEFNRVSMRFANLTLQGEGAGTGLRLNSQRAHIENCSFTDFATGLQLTDSGQNLVESAIYRCVFARCREFGIDVAGAHTTDGFINDTIVMESEVGIRITNANGWLLSGNHVYGCGVGIRLAGSMVRVQSNFLEVVNRPRPVGLEITLNGADEMSVVMGGVFVANMEGATLLKLIATAGSRIIVSSNQFFVWEGGREVTGIAVEGSGTLYGTLTFNNFSPHLANRVTGAPAETQFIHFSGDQLWTQANQLHLSRWSRTPTVLVGDGNGNADLASGSLRLQSQSRLHSGSGRPESRLGADGDFYFRSDGGSGSALYYKSRGRWAAIA